MPVFTSSLELSDDYPSVEPSLKLNFARSRTLDPRITFTRSSVGTYVGRDGLVKTASNNEARFDHDPTTGESLGLLSEEERTNLIAYSVINTANWNTNTSSNTNNTTETKAPDGSNTAFKYVPNNGGTGWVSVYNTPNVISMTSGTKYTYSVWAKPSHSDFTGFRINGDIRDGGGIAISANFVLSGDGSVSGTYDSASITKYPNGWYRCVATATADATTTEEPAFQTSSAGDGTKGFYVWGYQVEVGVFATSYIPTSGAAVTRQPDRARITGIPFSDFFNTEEGTLVVQGRTAAGNSEEYTNKPIISIHNGNTTNRIIMFDRDGGTLEWNVVDGSSANGSGLLLDETTSYTGAADYTMCGTYKNGAPTRAVANGLGANGTTIESSGKNDTVNTFNQIDIGNELGTRECSSTIKQVRYYPQSLSDTLIKTLVK